MLKFSEKRNYTLLDQVLIQFQHGLNTLCAEPQSERPYPAAQIPEGVLTADQQHRSRQMMRVNHTGEVCAQALYYGQMAVARSPDVYRALEQAAAEENDHLAWTAQRLTELNSHQSYFNPLWYVQAYGIGFIAGLGGDRWSLGFIEETERQVVAHLDDHLSLLPLPDLKSRQIIKQMRTDELQHGRSARQAGAKPLPTPIKYLMSWQAKIMTTIAAWI